jgi:hypothetical protein
MYCNLAIKLNIVRNLNNNMGAAACANLNGAHGAAQSQSEVEATAARRMRNSILVLPHG